MPTDDHQPPVGPVVAVGELDANHVGHAQLLDAAVTLARRLRRPLAAVVLDDVGQPRLSSPEQRVRRLLALGVNEVRVLTVDARSDPGRLAAAIASLDPTLVVTACAPAPTGVARAGRAAGGPIRRDRSRPSLAAVLRHSGVEVVEVERPMVDGAPVTSERVRAAVRTGAVAAAGRLLPGGAYTSGGQVVRGDQLGRTIGFPTANLVPSMDLVIPAHGVYAARAELPGGAVVAAAVNVGVRPTVADTDLPLIEAHLLDVDVDLYDRHLTLRFVDRLRDERRFDGIDALIAQLHRDVAQVRARLARTRHA